MEVKFISSRKQKVHSREKTEPFFVNLLTYLNKIQQSLESGSHKLEWSIKSSRPPIDQLFYVC